MINLDSIPKTIVYKRLTKDGKFYRGYTVKDCKLIDHFLSQWWDIGMKGYFLKNMLSKLKLIAKLHGYKLKEENKR
jgi:hypothetical protein